MANPASAFDARTATEIGARIGELFEAHARLVHGLCRVILRDRDEAEDAVQQTFLSAYRSMLKGIEPQDPPAWLATIARNECRTRLRARMARPVALVDDLERSTDDVERAAAHRAEIEALCAAIAELPERQREAVLLREFYGLSYDEVAVALELSGAAVDSLLWRSRQRLQEVLRPARMTGSAFVVPASIGETLARVLPGFSTASAGAGAAVIPATGLLVKAAAPLAAKVAAAALAVTAVGTVAAGSEAQSKIDHIARQAAANQARTNASAAPSRVVKPGFYARLGPRARRRRRSAFAGRTSKRYAGSRRWRRRQCVRGRRGGSAQRRRRAGSVQRRSWILVGASERRGGRRIERFRRRGRRRRRWERRRLELGTLG
jgi:RNA polymerase sigma factor (sigma-70 family)